MKKLMISLAFAVVLMVLSILMLLYPESILTIVFLSVAVFILYGALKELYVVLKFALPSSLRNVGIIKNGINIVLSIIIIFLSFSKPEALMNIVVYLIAVDLLLSAIIDTVDYLTIRNLGFSSVISLDVIIRYVLSVLMFFFPSFISGTFMKIIAIIILISSVLIAVAGIWSYRREKDEIFAEYEEKD